MAQTPQERETARQLAYYQTLIDAEQGKSTSDVTRIKAERAAEKLRQAQARQAQFRASPLAQQLIEEKPAGFADGKMKWIVGGALTLGAAFFAYKKWGK